MGWLFFILWIILIGIFSDHFWLVTILYVATMGIGYVIYTEIKKVLAWKRDAEKYHKHYNEIIQLETKKRTLESSIKKLAEEQIKFHQEKANTIQEIKQLAQEKSSGFPWLSKAYADYFYLQKLKEADYLEHKSHPAPVSAEKVREIAQKRRIIEEKLRIAQGIIN